MSRTGCLSLRPAGPFDIDALTNIGIAAFPHDPQWPYRYPYAQDFPEDHVKFTRERYVEWLKAAEGPVCKIMVVEINEDVEGKGSRRVIAFGIWRSPSSDKSDEQSVEKLNPPISKPFRRDCSPTHMAAYRAAILAAQAHIIDTLSYRSTGICLAQLVTNPSYFRRGAASLLLEWGIAWAEKDHVPITLFAGPMAIDLYRRYGFQTIVSVKVRCSGEETGIEFPGMKWEPNSREKKEKCIVIVYNGNSST